METQKFKMTFKNSWWQCLVSLLVSWLLIRTIVIAVFVFSHIGLADQDITRAGNILALIFAVWFAYYFSHRSWKKKQKKIINQNI